VNAVQICSERIGALAPSGYRAGAAAAHVRGDGDRARLDVAILASEVPASAAGVFTRNRLKAAPVVISQLTLRRQRPVRAVVVNSGNANACTGPGGFRDALRMCSLTAAALELEPSEVLVCSTGVIGRSMPMERIAGGISDAAALGDRTGEMLAQAMLTTDTRMKHAASRFAHDGVVCTVGGVAKGAGMIHPDMATLLCLLTTDVAATPETLQGVLRDAVDDSLNCMTVDGDTSPNDTVLLLANGAAGGAQCAPGSGLHAALREAVRDVCDDLAEQLVADAEGSQRYFLVSVTGAADDAEARLAARAVAGSSLVKTAVHGADPNWGRIVAAVGRSGAAFTLDRCSVSIGGHTVLHNGIADNTALDDVRSALRAPRVDVDLTLGDGPGSAHCWGCELSADYVHINADYTT